MTNEDYKTMQLVLEGRTPEGRVTDPLVDRLRRMACDRLSHKCGDADLASLLANIMRRELSLNGGASIREVLMGSLAAVSTSTLQQCHLEVIEREPDRLVVEATEWQPSWVQYSAEWSIANDALAGIKRRAFEPCRPDPFLRRLSLNGYRCVGQREAVRAALTMPEGATLLVNLPTGAGKSLLSQLPCVMDQDSLTVVVVPTTALCIDQERALREATQGKPDAVEHDTAYYAGEGERGERIRERIRRGEQRIVFASPEAVCGRLSYLLYEVAQRHSPGRLRWLVIDEAHMVEQWGGSFRSEFQGLAGLRTAMVRAGRESPLRTLLLSATFTPTCIVGLEHLFAKPGPFAVMHAVQLRPEPSCWFVRCDSVEQQRVRVAEAVLNLPRPLILYTTKIDAAQQWHHYLRSFGLLRTGLVIGATKSDERRRVMKGLRQGLIEVVVANSAFGLGVDADVRSVVHACVPENLDRYYQEVGRGGRDGLASVSMVIYTRDDIHVAREMNKQAVIGRDKGLKRWRRLFALKADLGDASYRLRLDTGPRRNAHNFQWDNHTLNLLARAGVVELDWAPPEFPSEDAPQEEWTKFRDEVRRRRVVRVLDNAPLEEATWDMKVEPERLRVAAANRRGFELMSTALRGERCLADIAGDLYGDDGAVSLPGGAIPVAKCCGGCPACRRAAISPWANAMPVPRQPWTVNRRGITPALARLLWHGSPALFYTSADAAPGWRGLNETLSWLVRAGLHFVAAPRDLLETWTPPSLQEPVFVSEDWPLSDPPSVPVLIVHPRGQPVPSDLYGLVGPQGRPGIMFFEDQVLTATGRRLRDVIRTPSFGFDELQIGWME